MVKHWILLTKEHPDTVWIVPEGDHYTYEIAPQDDLKKGDVAYLWSNVTRAFYGWGNVAETPQIIKVIRRHGNHIEEVKRQSVVVNRLAEFRPAIDKDLLQADRNLRKVIPDGYDDLYALYLRPGLANYLNDSIRQHGGTPPSGSSTLIAYTHEPQLIKQLGDFSEKEKQILSYHYVDRLSIKEIAGFWNLPVKTVEEHLEIAIRKLLSFRRSSYLDRVEGKTIREQELPASLIEVVETINALTPDLINHLKQHEDDFRKLQPHVFEHLVGELLRQREFDEVQLVGQDARTSADILAVKKLHGINEEVRYFVEVKRLKDKLGIGVINNVYGAMLLEQPDYGWNAAMIVSLVGTTNTRKITLEKLARLNITLKQKG